MTIEQRAGEFPWIGDPAGLVEVEGPIRWQRYTSGATLVESPHGTFIVYGAIAERYGRLGGPVGGLGPPLTDEVDTGDGVGRCNEFAGGGIFWSPTTGAHEVHGDIGATWRAEGGVGGRLGYPITEERRAGGYAYQYFQFGPLRWTPTRGTERGSPPDRLFGLADTHCHPAAALGFGGLVHGEVEGAPQQALCGCEPTHGVHGLGANALELLPLIGLGLGTVLTGDLIAGLTALRAFPKAFLLSAFEQSLGHKTHGWPEFDGWATWWSRTHQQMHVDWVRRSYDHGQRLMVALAVHSELVAGLLGRPEADTDAAIAQVRFLRDLAARHADWMAVATSPAEAREIIASDRLAIVLGVELDFLGGTAGRQPTTPAAIGAAVDQLWAEGVRYVFPIHLADNAYGGMALYDQAFLLQSAVANGRAPDVDENPDVDFHAPLFPDGSRPGHVNRAGLTEAGRELLRQLMRRGMLIDIDHMSWRATGEALALAEAERYPLVSGHATFHDLVPPAPLDEHSARNESRKTASTLERLRQLGSFVGIQPVPLETVDPPGTTDPVGPDCPGSSTTFARALRYARVALGGRVAIGSDLNGMARTSCPRFGPGAGARSVPAGRRRQAAEAQTGGVRYRTPLTDTKPGRLDPPDGIFDGRARDMLRAVLLAESGLPEDRWGYGALHGPWPAYVRGMRAAAEPTDQDERVGFLALHDGDLSRLPDDKVADVWELRGVHARWQATKGPNPPLERCVTGGHDFDFNLDGLAHYGMLPDLLADTANLGLAWDGDLRDLLMSSETVVQTWEKCTGDRPRGYEDPALVMRRDPLTLAGPQRTSPVELPNRPPVPEDPFVVRVPGKP